jgi:hypothetical protein
VVPSTQAPLSPFAGAEDLNASAALQLDGVLFMEGEGRPSELAHLISDLRITADEYASTGTWLANAMQASWDIAAELVDTVGLEDLVGDRHRIIANDWLAASTSALIAHMLVRAADMCSDSAGLVNDNERRWRVFRERVLQIAARRNVGRSPSSVRPGRLLRPRGAHGGPSSATSCRSALRPTSSERHR